MSGKNLPPPAGAADLTQLLRQRHTNTDDSPPATAEPAATPIQPTTATRRTKGSDMDRRSWYMPKLSADALADAVDELHYATRQPKHVVMAALVTVVLGHLDDVQKRIERPR